MTLPELTTQTAPRARTLPPENGDSNLLSEVMQKTNDLRETLGARWGIPKKEAVQSFARSFITSKSDFGWEVVHQFMTVCSELDLNPARKEVAAFYAPDKGLTTFVMIDGWLTLANRQPDFDGWELVENRDKDGTLTSVTCKVFRKGRTRATEVTVKMSEWRVGGSPQWMMKPEWMLQLKSIKQGLRLAFSFAGLTDDDEAYAMHGPQKAAETVQEAPKGPQLADLKAGEAPPSNEYERKPEPAKQVKLDELKPAPKKNEPKPEPQPEPDLPKAEEPPPVEEKKAEPPKVEAPATEPTDPRKDPDFDTPVICGRDPQDKLQWMRKPPRLMTKDEIAYALAYNVKQLAKAVTPKTVDKLKKIESFLVEVGRAKEMTGEEIVPLEDDATEQPATSVTAVSEPEQPADAPKGPTKDDGREVADWLKARRKAKKMTLSTLSALTDIAPGDLTKLENGDVSVFGAVSDYSIEQMAQVLSEDNDTSRLEILMDLFGRK